MSRSVETLYRQWVMLAKIPRFPRRISVLDLKQILSAEGFEIDVRTVQRDLDKLSLTFPLNYDTEGRKNYWFWIETASVQDLPGMEPVTALAFEMAESYLTPILPKATLDLLQPYFQRAKQVLQAATHSQLKKWPDKVAIISRGPDLIKPKIAPELQHVVYEALLKEKQIKATYKPRTKRKSVVYNVHPLGIVNRHGVIYLVCTLWDYQDIKQLALHRLKSAEILEDKAASPESFNLSSYIKSDNQFAYPVTTEMIRLKVLFEPITGEHLFETPLASDQIIVPQDDGRLLLEASVADTQELRWWLSGFGSQIEVQGPPVLREYFQNEANLLVAQYSKQSIYKSPCNDAILAKLY